MRCGARRASMRRVSALFVPALFVPDGQNVQPVGHGNYRGQKRQAETHRRQAVAEQRDGGEALQHAGRGANQQRRHLPRPAQRKGQKKCERGCANCQQRDEFAAQRPVDAPVQRGLAGQRRGGGLRCLERKARGGHGALHLAQQLLPRPGAAARIGAHFNGEGSAVGREQQAVVGAGAEAAAQLCRRADGAGFKGVAEAANLQGLRVAENGARRQRRAQFENARQRGERIAELCNARALSIGQREKIAGQVQQHGESLARLEFLGQIIEAALHRVAIGQPAVAVEAQARRRNQQRGEQPGAERRAEQAQRRTLRISRRVQRGGRR